jgi:OmpA-OmpF porin, OOP family
MNHITSACLLAMGGLALQVNPANAQAQSYPYGGISAGQSSMDMEEGRIARSQLDPGQVVTRYHQDKRDNAYKLFGGYQFNPYYAVEGGYFYLGDRHVGADTTPTGTLSGRVKVQGWNADLVGFLPMDDALSLMARVGAQYAKTSARFEGSGAVVPANPTPGKSQLSAKFGVGLQYALSSAFLVRGEWERYRVSDAMGDHNGVNVVSLSLVFPFGRSPASSQRAAIEPMPEPPVVAAPPPPIALAPVESMPPPAAGIPITPHENERKRVAFNAESMFGFDTHDVQPQARLALDGFVRELDGTSYDVIVVEGHTDRIGTREYNQRLSQERADAVKDYLVETGKVSADKISAKGMSESVPVTQAQDCQSGMSSADLIVCLQPDRRVEIGVVGSR